MFLESRLTPFSSNENLGVDPDYRAPRTDQFLVAVERELFKNFGLAANVTWRRYNGFNWLNYPGVTGEEIKLVP